MNRARSLFVTSSCAALMFGLASCGSSTSTGSPASNPVTTASAAAHPPQVIKVASGGGAASPSAASGELATDSAELGTKMRPYWNVDYQYEGTPPDLTAPAGSWYFAPGSDPTDDQIAAIAAALGVTGDVTRLSADQGGGWIVGPQDYSAATISVNTDAMHSWYFSAAPSVSSPGGVACAGSGVVDSSTEAIAPPDSAATPDTLPVDIGQDPASCAAPEPPTGVPTADEAKAKATALFAALGIDTSSYELEVYADEWNANVTGFLVLDGIRTTVSVSVGFGAEGALTWANGFLGTPQRGGDYDRIGVPAALERLTNQNSQWMGLESGVPTDAAATDVATDVATDAVEPPAAPVDCATNTTDCPPVDVTVDTTPVVVTLSNARQSLEQLWAEDGTVWLLPGYVFDSADGGMYSVIAVPDQYIQVTAPIPVPEPALDTVVPETVVSETAVPETVVPETVVPETAVAETVSATTGS